MSSLADRLASSIRFRWFPLALLLRVDRLSAFFAATDGRSEARPPIFTTKLGACCAQLRAQSAYFSDSGCSCQAGLFTARDPKCEGNRNLQINLDRGSTVHKCLDTPVVRVAHNMCMGRKRSTSPLKNYLPFEN